jgi:hypothetical protein
MVACSRYFDGAFPVLPAVILGEIIIDLTGSKSRLAGDRLNWHLSTQEIDDLAQAVSAVSS